MAGLIVHEWVAKSGGSEKVLDQFALQYPEADIQVLWTDDPERFSRPVRETWLAKSPLRHHKAATVPILPVVWRQLQSSERPDWMLVSSHLFAHHARIRRFVDVPKLVYVHTPARYIWEPELDHRGSNAIVRMVGEGLKPIDRKRSREAHAIAVNSEFTRRRVQRVWDRDSKVIYPPVDTARIHAAGEWSQHVSGVSRDTLDSLPADYVLGASRFVSYKRLELVISCAEANGVAAVIAGSGPDRPRLLERAERATVPVHFIDRPEDALLYALYQRSLAYVFPAIEDFGIMPVEAMATGTPAIVPSTGGAAESVRLVGGGSTFEADTPESWKSALSAAVGIDRPSLAARSRLFSNERFRQEVASWMTTSLGAPSQV